MRHATGRALVGILGCVALGLLLAAPHTPAQDRGPEQRIEPAPSAEGEPIPPADDPFPKTYADPAVPFLQLPG